MDNPIIITKLIWPPLIKLSGNDNDTQKNEYWIPIGSVIHTYVPWNGIIGPSLENNLQLSDGDKENVVEIQNNSSLQINFYVIESKDNGKFLISAYDKNSPYHDIIANELNLSELCPHFN